MKNQIVITCEHASNRVPSFLKKYFTKAAKTLSTHRAWDPGAAPIAKHLSKKFKVPLFQGQYTRLAIDLNRSAQHKTAFSEFSRNIPNSLKTKLENEIHAPYQTAVKEKIQKIVSRKQVVLHFSIHSFTPVLNGETRNCEIGLLYDPGRPLEKRMAKLIGKNLKQADPNLRIRYNYPYKGVGDGLTTQIRKKNIFKALFRNRNRI